MRKSVIIGKRQIILAVLVIALGAAVYLNYRFASVNVAPTSTAQKGTMGGSTYVNGSISTTSTAATKTVATATDAVIASAKVQRDDAQKQSLATFQKVIDDAKSDTTVKAQATKDAATLATNIKEEGLIEAMLTTKGFTDCVAVINGDKINVVVKNDKQLLASQTLQIQDVVVQQTGDSVANIQISQVN